MSSRSTASHARRAGLAAAALAIAGTGIALASTDRHIPPISAPTGYSRQ